MKYQAVLSHVTGKVETLKTNDSADAYLILRDARENPFLKSAMIQAVSVTGQVVTLGRFIH